MSPRPLLLHPLHVKIKRVLPAVLSKNRGGRSPRRSTPPIFFRRHGVWHQSVKVNWTGIDAPCPRKWNFGRAAPPLQLFLMKTLILWPYMAYFTELWHFSPKPNYGIFSPNYGIFHPIICLDDTRVTGKPRDHFPDVLSTFQGHRNLDLKNGWQAPFDFDM